MGIGKLLSGVVKVVSTPVTIIESGIDVLTGGDGSQQSKDQSEIFMGNEIRKGICKGLEDLDRR